MRSVLVVLLAAFAAALLGASTAPGAPSPQAPSAILFQPDTGDVVYRRADTERRQIASTTKLMTALVTREHADLDDTFRAVAYPANPVESLMGLRAGERMSVRDLLEGLLLASGNDAAATLAVRVGGSRREFVRMMNRRARELGLRDTRFANPIGLDDPRNHSTAADLVKLALVVLRDPFLARTVDRESAVVGTGDRRRTVVNRNTLVRTVGWVDGVKTGHTSQAGYVLVGAAKRRGVRVVSAVLGDPSEAARDADTLELLRWGLARYRLATPVRRGEALAEPRLAYRDETVELVAARRVRTVLRRGEDAEVRVVGAPAEIDGALRAGERVGAVVVSRRGKEVARVPLVASEAVAAASLGDRVSSALPSAWLSSALLGLLVVVGCSLHLALRRRRRTRRRQARARRRGGTEAA